MLTTGNMFMAGVPAVLCLSAAIALAAGVWIVVVALPGVRHRWIFRRRPLLLVLWLRGELSLCATLLTAGPLAAGVYWWVCAMGYGLSGGWQSLLGGLWCLLSGLALLNATRKSRPEGLPCAALVMLVTLLWLACAACLWRTLLIFQGAFAP